MSMSEMNVESRTEEGAKFRWRVGRMRYVQRCGIQMGENCVWCAPCGRV